MSNPNYEKKPGNWPDPQASQPFSENQPFESETDPLAAPAEPPPLYEPYAPPEAGSYQRSAQIPQAIFIVTPQPTNEPEHLGYSIFTMLCCCLPLGIAALIYSIKTRDANLAGNGTEAQQYSRKALLFSRLAVGGGLIAIILYVILVAVSVKSSTSELQNP